MATGQGGSSIDLALRGLSTTARQVQHWVKQGWLKPLSETGTGYATELGREELRVLRRMAQLVQTGLRAEAASRIARESIEASANTMTDELTGVMIIFKEP